MPESQWGTFDFQIRKALANTPGFQGVYMSDKVMGLDTSNWPANSTICVNYDPSKPVVLGWFPLKMRFGSHWCCIGSLGPGSAHPPVWFDSLAGEPDGWDQILKVKTRFREFLERESQKNGFGGEFWSNRLELQCLSTGNEPGQPSDQCGEWSIFFAKQAAKGDEYAGLPISPVTGQFNPAYKALVNLKTQCWDSGKLIRAATQGVRSIKK